MKNNGNRLRESIKAWDYAEKTLNQLRFNDIQNAETIEAIERLDGAFKAISQYKLPQRSSGLIEQQKIFQRISP